MRSRFLRRQPLKTSILTKRCQNVSNRQSYGYRKRPVLIRNLLDIKGEKQHSMLPSFRTGPIFVQKKLYSIIFVGRSHLCQPKNSKNNTNISGINCRFWRAFWRRNRPVWASSFVVSKSLAANICTAQHCIVDKQISLFVGNFARNFIIFGEMIDKGWKRIEEFSTRA